MSHVEGLSKLEASYILFNDIFARGFHSDAIAQVLHRSRWIEHFCPELRKELDFLVADAPRGQLLIEGVDRVLENVRSDRTDPKWLLFPRERVVLIKRHGLDDGRLKTFEEIGRSIGVGYQSVRQDEIHGLRRLRRSPISQEIRHLLP